MSKVSRNDPCPCGSGKKFKKCCGQKSPMQRRSFSNLRVGAVRSSIDKISSMVSKNIVANTQSQSESLAERISKSPPEKKDSKQSEENTENSSSENLES